MSDINDRGTHDQQRALLLDLIDHVRWLSEGDETAMAHITNAIDSYMKWEGLREESLVLDLVPRRREWSPESHLGALQDAVGPTSGKLTGHRPMRKRKTPG